jgi:Type II intron maturase
MNADDHAIINTYGAEYRGIVGYYRLASDVWRLNRLHWVMETSLLKTLAGKHHSSVSKMARKYKATIDTPAGPRTCLQARTDRGEGRKPLLAQFGGIPLTPQNNTILIDRDPVPATSRPPLAEHRGVSALQLAAPAVELSRLRT